MADVLDTTYVVLYRTGGWQSCRWNRVLETYTSVNARKKVIELQAAGYKALSRTVAEHDLLGLPIGWTHKLVDHEVDAIDMGRYYSHHTVHYSRLCSIKARIEKGELKI
jgi:hypothetical protein